ncbi:MAG: sugar transferase [bacterium]|nr:MAG: sugar transferase [bacterium]
MERVITRKRLTLPKYRPYLAHFQIILDILVAIISFYVATYLFNHALRTFLPILEPVLITRYPIIIFLVVLFLPFSKRLSKVEDPYRPFRLYPIYRLLIRILVVVIVEMVIVSSITVIGHFAIPNHFLVLLALVLWIMLVLKEFLMPRILFWLQSKERCIRNVAIYGIGEQARNFLRSVLKNPHWGLRIIGLITDQDTIHSQRQQVGERGRSFVISDNLYGYPVLGDFDHVQSVLIKHSINDLIIAPQNISDTKVQELLRFCEEIGVSAKLLLDCFRTNGALTYIEVYDESALITFTTVPCDSLPLFIKEVFDRLTATIAIIILGPLLMFPIALAVKLSSNKGESVIFKQKRVGLYGQTFCFYKFRTMASNAEEQKVFLERMNEMDGPVFKIKNDPRITPLGRFLRKYSLDELPQFFNVLLGQMSIVGVRPPLPKEVVQYEKKHLRRLSMKPGMTCIWQVSGRNKVSFEEWMRMDLEYIDNWSLWQDIKILLLTVYAVFAGQGM